MKRSCFPALLIVFVLVLTSTVFSQTAPEASAVQTKAPKAAPEAKTQEELDAFMAATAVKDLTAAEAAADDFASKFPDSTLRAGVYSNLMQQYQKLEKPEKAILMGRKVLSLDPENPLALVVTATSLVENTHETTPDREQRLNEAAKNADTAVKTMDDNLIVAQLTPEQATAMKTALLTAAHYASGLVAYKQEKWDAAELHFKAAVAANPSQPDPRTFMYLAIAQDRLKKYNEALDSINKAIASADTQKNTAVANAARDYKKRLVQLAAQTAPKKPGKHVKK